MKTHLMTPAATALCGKWQDGDQWAPNGRRDAVDCDGCEGDIAPMPLPPPAPPKVGLFSRVKANAAKAKDAK